MPSFSIREAIKQALLANTELAALVAPENIWAQFAPLGTNPPGPWIVMINISGNELGAHDGNCNLSDQRHQFTVGGTNKETMDLVVAILVQQFHCVNFVYTENAVPYEVTFFHEDHRDGWDEASRTYNPSVDLMVQFNY